MSSEGGGSSSLVSKPTRSGKIAAIAADDNPRDGPHTPTTAPEEDTQERRKEQEKAFKKLQRKNEQSFDTFTSLINTDEPAARQQFISLNVLADEVKGLR
jgi:hypothetical protein